MKEESFKGVIVYPVTGEEQDTKIQLPRGFIWKVVDAAKTKVMRILTANLNFDESDKNAFYSIVEFKGPIIVIIKASIYCAIVVNQVVKCCQPSSSVLRFYVC